MKIAALFTSLVSVINFAYLSFLHYGTKFGLAEGKSICNINASLNCDAVTVSSYATLFNIPLSNWGAVTSAIISLVLIIEMTGISQNRERLYRFAFWLATLGLIASLVMAFISFFFLGTFCIFCIAAYLLSALTWFFLFRSTKRPLFSHLPKDLRQRGYLITLLLIPAFSYLSNAIAMDSLGLSRVKNITEESLFTWKNSPVKDFDPHSGLIQASKTGPTKMTIVEFGDFLCTHCKSASFPLHNFVDSRDGVQLIFKVFPLDGTCNEAITHKGDGLRCDLAYFVYCADKVAGKGWPAHDYVYARQSAWNKFNFDTDAKTAAGTLGLDFPLLSECMKADETRRKILSQAKEAGAIHGTPAIFVNGRDLPYGQLIPILDAVRKEVN
jgi:uncharacterized membrane protein/protein-disulfide isomerase